MTTRFQIATPVLSRGTADRSEDLRHPDRVLRMWPTSRVLTLDPAGRCRVDPGPVVVWSPATGDSPPPGAVLLGTVHDVDHWAVTGPVPDGASFREVGAALSDTDAGLLTTAVAVLTWHARGSFCPVCGQASVPDAAGWSRTCPNEHQEWPRTDPAVIVLVHDGADRVALARQPVWPAGRYSVLAGFTEAGESLEGTVRREIYEEIGVRVDDVRYLGSQPWPFPRSLMVGFAARAEPGAPLVPRDGEIEHAEWFDRGQIRALLSAGGRAARMDPADRGGLPDNMTLPDEVSIARRMVQGWADAG